MNRKPIYAAVLLVFTTLVSVVSGCGSLPIYFWNSPPLLYGAEGSDTSILVIQRGDLYGYADTTGKIVIKPQYSDAHPFYEGLAAVKGQNAGYGYIDKTGKTVIPFRYYGASDFHNGRALASDRLKHSGELNHEVISVIDLEGNTVRETEYTLAWRYIDGITIVSDATDLHNSSLLDENYNELNVPLLARGNNCNVDFSEGLTAFRLVGDELFSFMDKAGNKAFNAQFFATQPFSEGLAPVIPSEEEGLWGYVDKFGKMAIAAQYLFAGRFGEGLAPVETADREWRIIDTSGRETCAMLSPVDNALPFSEGLCAVGKLKQKQLYDYHYGYYALNYDWGYMDTSGEMVIDFKYDLVTPFKNGIAEVLLDGKIGYIDKTGKYIWEPR